MGIFNFLKGNSNKPEYEDKPYEWFLSEEGRQSFLKYADNWRDMDAWLIEVGAWERGFEKVGRMCKSIDSPSERQKSWPCFYLYHFVKALKNKYKKNKDTKAEFSISRYFIFHNDIGMFLYYLSLMVPDDLNELKWPNFLTPEDNPLNGTQEQWKSAYQNWNTDCGRYEVHCTDGIIENE